MEKKGKEKEIKEGNNVSENEREKKRSKKRRIGKGRGKEEGKKKERDNFELLRANDLAPITPDQLGHCWHCHCHVILLHSFLHHH